MRKTMQIKHITRTVAKVTGVVFAGFVAFAWIVGDPDKFQKDVVGRTVLG